jgi:hypothetical protein
VAHIGVDSLTRTGSLLYQHQFFPGGNEKQPTLANCMFRPMDHENGPWSSPSNRDHTMAQGGETLSHPKEWDMTAWNWDSVAFVAQSASGMATDAASGGTQIYSVDENEEYRRVPELTLQLDRLSGDHVQPLLGEGSSESELRCRSFCRSQSPSPALNGAKRLTRDDTAPEELESLSLKLGGSSYPILEEDGISSHGAKRFCTSSPQSQFPMCQVDNCKADLSEAKDYHRRHKVCEMHSKAVEATVTGVMQRFCQQCSRSIHLFILCSSCLVIRVRFVLLAENRQRMWFFKIFSRSI